MKQGSILYHRSHNPDFKLSGNKLVWFSFSEGSDGSSYGKYITRYKVLRKLKLLDLGKQRIRDSILQRVLKTKSIENGVKESFRTNFDPNVQWSGGKANTLVHVIIQQLFGKLYDGTIIDDSAEEEHDLDGAEEVVLWPPYSTKVKLVR